MSAPEANPFCELIVKDPRQREPAVAGLNERPLQVIFEEFERLAAGPAPREIRRTGQALLITSSQPGYGKSHLLARIFRELRGRATVVYVLPFQNPATVFQSLMLAIARELDFPEEGGSLAWDRDAATQLDHLAHALLAHCIADLIESGRVEAGEDERAQIVERLRGDPLNAFGRGVPGENWAGWLDQNFARLLRPMESALASRGLALSNPSGWLKGLRAYAMAAPDSSARRTCLDWMTAQPLDDADLELLGMRRAEAVPVEAGPAEANQVCRSHVSDIAQLAGYFRPFVFCFDQTEVYGHHAPLARAFGLVIGRLLDEAVNHLALVTSNQDPWNERIKPHMERADQDRIAPPLALDGLDKAQAEQLAKMRMEAASIDPAKQAQFLSGTWLADPNLFQNAANRVGARYFLQKCRERWTRAPIIAVTLARLYDELRRELLASPKRHRFEPDTLEWVIEEAADGLEGVTVTRLDERYFTVMWQTPSRICYFGFANGSHWAQWKAIANAAVSKCASGPRPSKAIFFRAPDQPPIPRASWSSASDIERAKSAYLHLIVLTLEQVAELYAAKELFAQAAQGDIPFDTDIVLAFLREQLAPWWDLLKAPIGHPEAHVPQLAAPVSTEA